MRRLSGDRGNGVVEFVWLGTLLLVPLCYVMLFAFDVQRAAFGVTEAARQAGRTLVTSCGRGDAAARAEQAASLALADQHVTGDWRIDGLSCPPPGGQQTVRVGHTVRIPGLGTVLPAGRGGIPVTATFVAVRDRFDEQP